MSEPRRRKGNARCCILFGGPTLFKKKHDLSEYAFALDPGITYPNFPRERKSSGASESCSHFEIVGPKSRGEPDQSPRGSTTCEEVNGEI